MLPTSSPRKEGVYTRDHSSPSTPSSRQYASPARARGSASPSPGKPLYFSPVAQKTVSVLSRPKNLNSGYKNIENLDVQYERDLAAQERHAASYRRQYGERWHHHGPGTQTILEQGHIVDKGRGRSTIPERGVFDPILSEFRVPPTNDSYNPTSSRPTRPSSAPPARGHAASAVNPPWRGDKMVQAARGVCDPITGVSKAGSEPEPAYAARKQVEFERSTGTRGITSRASKDFSFNPITGQMVPVSPAARQQQQQQQQERPRPQSAPRAARNVTRADRPDTPSKRPIHNGQTWGQYNPITHMWQVPPSDSKFADVSAQLEKTHYVTGSHVRKVELPARQGVYNPILNTWSVPPADPRVWGGLSFAPATMFSRATPATIRSPN